MAIQRIKPTEAEIEILQILWDKGPSTVRFVNDKLNEKKDVGYTTTLKIMQIMNEKGLVSRKKEKRSHVYSASYSEDTTRELMMDRILNNLFSGSAKKLVMQVLGSKKTSKEEIKEIKKFIADLEKKK